MNIQAISNIKFNPIRKTTNNNITQFLKPQNDSISFKGKVLTYEELRPLKIRAWQVQNESIEHKKEAHSAKDEAYEKLSVAKSEFLQALKYCNLYKKNPTKTTHELKNGNTLKFQFEFKKGNLSFEIEESNEDGAIIKTISALNFIPTKIIDFSNEQVDVYEFRGNQVAILENLGIDGSDFGACDKFSSFTNGKINTISINGNVSKSPSEFEKTYVYFDDNPISCSFGNIVYQNGTCASDERFVYIGESFANYYSNFKGNIQGGMSFNESLHYDKGKFIGSINNGSQSAKNQDIISSDATFLNDDNNFIHTTKMRARVSDFGLPIFADCE